VFGGILVFFVGIIIQQEIPPDAQVIRGLVAGISAGVALAVWVLLRPAIKCPECGKLLPKFRKPKTKEQALWGGGICPNCGTKIDRKGRRGIGVRPRKQN